MLKRFKKVTLLVIVIMIFFLNVSVDFSALFNVDSQNRHFIQLGAQEVWGLSKPIYFYNKYYSAFTNWSPEVYKQTNDYPMPLKTRIYGYTSEPQWDGSKYITTGTPEYGTEGMWTINNSAIKCSKNQFFFNHYDSNHYYYYNCEWSRSRSTIMGSFIGTVTAEDGVYPDNGQHSDGYWYLKVTAIPLLSILSPSQNGTLFQNLQMGKRSV
jgi:hypothetical protein